MQRYKKGGRPPQKGTSGSPSGRFSPECDRGASRVGAGGLAASPASEAPNGSPECRPRHCACQRQARKDKIRLRLPSGRCLPVCGLDAGRVGTGGPAAGQPELPRGALHAGRVCGGCGRALRAGPVPHQQRLRNALGRCFAWCARPCSAPRWCWGEVVEDKGKG